LKENDDQNRLYTIANFLFKKETVMRHYNNDINDPVY